MKRSDLSSISQLWVFWESKSVSAFLAEKDSVDVELER